MLQAYLPIVMGIDNIYNKLLVGITSVFWLHWIFFGLVGGIVAIRQSWSAPAEASGQGMRLRRIIAPPLSA